MIATEPLESRIEDCSHIIAEFSFDKEVWSITDERTVIDKTPVYRCNNCKDFIEDTDQVYTLYDKINGLYLNTNI